MYAGATPNRLAALVSGAVQAALLTQPFDFRAERKAIGSSSTSAPSARNTAS
jgi:hypothetical protein